MTTPRKSTKKKATTPAKAKAAAEAVGFTAKEGSLPSSSSLAGGDPMAVKDEMIAMWDVPPSEEVPTAVINARDSASQPTEALGIYHSDGRADLVSKGDIVVYADDEGNEWWATVTEMFSNGTANLGVPGMGAAQVANGVPFGWERGHPGTWVASDAPERTDLPPKHPKPATLVIYTNAQGQETLCTMLRMHAHVRAIDLRTPDGVVTVPFSPDGAPGTYRLPDPA